MANYTTMSLSATKYLCGLIRDLASVSEAIDDLNLRTDGTFSSVKIDKLITQCLQDANTYSDSVVNALTHLVAEKIDFEPTLDNTTDKLNTLLLYSKNSDNNFTQYLRLTNELLNLGDTSLSLNEYLKITEAEEKFVLKTDYEDLVTKVTAIDALVGNTILNTKAQNLTEAINELLKLIGYAAGDDVTTEMVTISDFSASADGLIYEDGISFVTDSVQVGERYLTSKTSGNYVEFEALEKDGYVFNLTFE